MRDATWRRWDDGPVTTTDLNIGRCGRIADSGIRQMSCNGVTGHMLLWCAGVFVYLEIFAHAELRQIDPH